VRDGGCEKRKREKLTGLTGSLRPDAAAASSSCGVPLNRPGSHICPAFPVSFCSLLARVPATPEHVSVDRFRAGYTGGRKWSAGEAGKAHAAEDESGAKLASASARGCRACRKVGRVGEKKRKEERRRGNEIVK